MAGLAAAKYAKDKGVKSVLVLDARDRIGGRTYTVPLNITLESDAPAPAAIDVGAAWIHGIGRTNNPNPMVALSRAAGLPVLQPSEEDTSFNPQGKEDGAAWDRAYSDMSDQFEGYLGRYASNGINGLSPSDGDSLAKVIDRIIADKSLSATKKDALLQYVQTEIVMEYADDPAQLSARYFDQDESWAGADGLPGRGYSALVAHLAKGINISLGCKVESLDYSLSKGPYVVVTGTNLQANTALSLSAKYVINTMPLGYLQAQLKKPSPNLFKPVLKSSQSAAILSLGMGLLQKIILVWRDDSWWQDVIKTPWFTVRNTTKPGAFSVFYNLAATPAELPVLVCFNGGSFARSVEALPDATIVAQALASLRRLLPPGSALPAPVQTIVTRWGADPWVLGAYSFHKAGAKEDARDTAFAAVGGGRVRFAGEATHDLYPATVHGAYLSGEREAKRVVALLGL